VPMKDERTVILIRQYRHAVGGYIYEIPAGKLHPGEDPLVCAQREMEEEIGYKAGILEHVTSAYTTPGFTDEIIHIYRATQLQQGQQNLGHDEVLEIAEFPLEKTIAMIREGVIQDAKTIVGLQSVYIQLLGLVANRDRRFAGRWIHNG